MTIWRYGRFVGCPRRTRLPPAMPAPWSLPTRRRWTPLGERAEVAAPLPNPTCQQTEPRSSRDQRTEAIHRPPGRFRPSAKRCRRRNKAHLAFVGAQPCLVCQRCPCDAHHLKFAQPRALGRKVSDEFTVPLCREHHNELHRHGNEMAWWANLQIAPLETARELWEATLLQVDPTSDRNTATKLDPARDAEAL